MNIGIWIVYLLFGFIAFAPLAQGSLFRVDKRYRHFLHVSGILVLWWAINLLRFVITDPTTIYLLTLLVYPLVFGFVAMLFIAILAYLKNTISRNLVVILTIIFIVNLVVSMTNSIHQLVLKVPLDASVDFITMQESDIGPLFYAHLAISYVLLLIALGLILKKSFDRVKENKDIYPFMFLLTAIFIGLGLNIYHIFINTIQVDPTLLFVISFVTVLYYVFYIRDLKLILGVNRNNYILEHLREKYVIVNEQGIVVDASSEFIELFHVDLSQELKYHELLNRIKDKVVLYQDTEDVQYDFIGNKMYFHTIEKDIKLPFYKHSGTFYLYFDQTANLKYINQMNYIKTHDLMTGLYNRNYLEEIRDSLDNHNRSYHVALFDLDGLKLFNDYLGHDKGDDVLIKFSNQLLAVTKGKEDYPIRLGGDEFLILAIDSSEEAIQSMVDEIESINENKMFLDEIHYSYAISSNQNGKRLMKDTLIEADKKMYEMKYEKEEYKKKLKKHLKEAKSKQ